MSRGWRYVSAPLAVWLLLVLAAAVGVDWMDQRGRHELEHRFNLRVVIASDFVSTYVSDLVARERSQAVRFLADANVSQRAFEESVAAFGYPAAVLLDSAGRLLQVVPASPGQIGQDLTTRYEHLRIAVRENRPAVSPVVPSAVDGRPVVAFAAPYDTPYGRRIFSGAVEVRTSPIGSYLPHAIALREAQVFLLDGGDTIVGANQVFGSFARLAERAPELAARLGGSGAGAYQHDGAGWRYDSAPVGGTTWRLVAAVPEQVLYQPLTGTAMVNGGGLAGVALLGLVAVGLAARGGRNRAQLRDSEERFRGLFDSSLVGMLLSSSTDGRLLRVNGTMCEMLGYRPDELTGRISAELIHPDDVAASTVLVHQALVGYRRGFTQEIRYLHADGHVVYASLTCTLIRDERGRPQHFATQVIDVSERVRLAEEQTRAREELALRATEMVSTNDALRVAQQRMADLVAMLAHDVRQPLGIISGYCELLLEAWDHSDDTHRRRDLARIARAGTGMMQLVEEVLTLTQLDGADLRPRIAPVSVLRAVDEGIAGMYSEQRAGVLVDVESGATVRADGQHLQQILVNLLSNARKYGGDAGVWVRAETVGDTVEISVNDAGEGVPAEFVPHLFERFTRADSGVAPTRKGTGLGLYIAHHLAEANGGTLAYEPNQPRGSRFVLRLPAVTPAVAAATEPVVARR